LTTAQQIERMVDHALERPSLRLVGAVNEPLPFDDPFADDTRPADRDHRGRLLAPIIRDEFIDVP